MADIQMAGPWITAHEIDTVMDAMQNGWYGENQYWYVEEFEKVFAKWHDRKHALMTPNCTSAIHLTLYSLGIGPGDEVILPECTWIASAAPTTYVGATPVFVDIDPVHWCIDPASLEAAITKNTKAVIMVNLFGNMPDIDAISAICDKHGITLIEDAAESLGSSYKGTKSGKFGKASVFSFHRTKTLTTGEGGMFLTDDDELFERAAFVRDHGRDPDRMYYNTEVAYKYMPFNIQAAIGYAQFQRVDELVDKKRWILQEYKKHLGDISDLYFNPEPEGGVNGVWCSTIVFKESLGMTGAKAIEKAAVKGVPLRPFFYPLSSLPAYAAYNEQGKLRNPIAYDVSSRGINLPSALNLNSDQIEEVSFTIRELLEWVR